MVSDDRADFRFNGKYIETEMKEGDFILWEYPRL